MSDQPLASSLSRASSDAFAAMPLVLKGITSFFVVYGVGSVALALIPGIEHRVAGQTFSQAEFFAAGHGGFALAMGGWLTASAFGLLRRATWGTLGTLLAYGLFVPAEYALAEEPRVGVQAGLAVLWAFGIAAYLFRARGAVAYLHPADGTASADGA